MGEMMDIFETDISDLKIIETKPFSDHRGVFARLFCKDDLKSVLGNREIVQINYSKTNALGTVRGMHFQYPPYAEMKLIRCIKGRVWDVAVDLRKDSPTFLKWHAIELSNKNMRMIPIPEGFAHGFQVLESESELLYLHTEKYTPDYEGGIHPLDQTIKISWPVEVGELSERDNSHPFLQSDFNGLIV